MTLHILTRDFKSPCSPYPTHKHSNSHTAVCSLQRALNCDISWAPELSEDRGQVSYVFLNGWETEVQGVKNLTQLPIAAKQWSSKNPSFLGCLRVTCCALQHTASYSAKNDAPHAYPRMITDGFLIRFLALVWNTNKSVWEVPHSIHRSRFSQQRKRITGASQWASALMI